MVHNASKKLNMKEDGKVAGGFLLSSIAMDKDRDEEENEKYDMDTLISRNDADDEDFRKTKTDDAVGEGVQCCRDQKDQGEVVSVSSDWNE